jgi:hypothetical protein
VLADLGAGPDSSGNGRPADTGASDGADNPAKKPTRLCMLVRHMMTVSQVAEVDRALVETIDRILRKT